MRQIYFPHLMVKLFRKFVEYLALGILIGGMCIVLYLAGKTLKEKYLDKAEPAPQEVVDEQAN